MTAVFLFQQNFVSWGLEHWSWLAAGLASMVFWIGLGRIQLLDERKRLVGLIQSLIPVGIWISISVYWTATIRPVPIDWVLPFHACYFLNLLMPVMLWRRSFFLFEVSYFMIMAGSLQGLLTPDLQTVFPDIMNIRYFFIHIGLAQSILFAIIVYGFRPTWRGLGKAFLWTNIYFVFVGIINLLLGTNFMYLRRKPNTTTLLDLFGPWPWYIVGGELLALVLYIVVLLPFAFRWNVFRRG